MFYCGREKNFSLSLPREGLWRSEKEGKGQFFCFFKRKNFSFSLLSEERREGGGPKKIFPVALLPLEDPRLLADDRLDFYFRNQLQE